MQQQILFAIVGDEDVEHRAAHGDGRAGRADLIILLRRVAGHETESALHQRHGDIALRLGGIVDELIEFSRAPPERELGVVVEFQFAERVCPHFDGFILVDAVARHERARIGGASLTIRTAVPIRESANAPACVAMRQTRAAENVKMNFAVRIALFRFCRPAQDPEQLL